MKAKNYKIWDQSFEQFQNGEHFKLSQVNLTRPGSNRVNNNDLNFGCYGRSFFRFFQIVMQYKSPFIKTKAFTS